MLSNRLAFAALALACIAAAATGGYLASRPNATSVVPAASASAPAPASAPIAAAPDRPVQETEAVVGDSTPKTPRPLALTAEAPAQPTPTIPAASRRNEVPARSASSAPRTAKPAPRNQAPPPLERTWPSTAAPAPPPTTIATAPPPSDPNGAQGARTEDRTPPEPPRAPEPPEKTFEELVVSSDSVIGLQTENTISSETARIEDRVDARVTRDVRVGDRVAIPAGARALGAVTQVEKGGKFKERARLGIRFHTLILADGTRVPLSTETIVREGEAPTAAQKVGGGAVAGAILGAILGGAKGAAIGGATGAGAGAAATAAGDRRAATLPAGTHTTVRILSPVTVTVEK